MKIIRTSIYLQIIIEAYNEILYQLDVFWFSYI